MFPDLTQTPSWPAALTAKAAFQSAFDANAPDLAQKRAAYTRAIRVCMNEAGLSGTPVRGTSST